MSQPLVSVIIPTYHQHQYLLTSVRSVQAQTYPNVQLLVVIVSEDMPTWDALQPVRYELGIVFSDKADHIHQINLGLKKANGEFVTLCGSDDFMLPNKIATEIAVAQAQKAVLVYSRFFLADEFLNIQLVPPLLPFSYENLTRRNFVTDCSLVAKSMYDEYGLFDDELGSLAVYDKWLHIAEKYEERIVLNPIPTFIYRTHPEQKHARRISDPKQMELYNQIVNASLRRKGLKKTVNFKLTKVECERV